MKFISAAIVGALLLVSLAVPLSSATTMTTEENSTVAVLFDFGNGRVMWADVPITTGLSAHNATLAAADDLGISIQTSTAGYINDIDGYADAWPNETWNFWTWNSGTGSWASSWVGAKDVLANSTAAVAWSYAAYVDPVEFVGPHAPIATPDYRYPWTSFRHDTMNTGAQLNKAPNNLTLLWEDDLANGAIDSPVVGAGGRAYVVTGGVMNMTTFGYDTNSTIFCLNSTGKVWSAEIGKGYQVASPLLYGNMVIVPSANGKVYAFNAEDGTALWTFDTGSALTYGVTSSPIAYRNDIIFAAGNGKVYSLHENGTLAWSTTVASVIYSSSPAVRDGVLYIGADDGKLHALAADGSGEQWSLALGGKVRGSPILMDDQIVVSFVNYTGTSPSNGGLAAVSYTGQLLWQTSIGVSPASATLTTGGIALMTADGMSMIGFDGAKLWNISLGTLFAGAAPTAVAGTVFAVTNEAQSRLVAVSDSGSLYWQEALVPDQYALCAPTVVDNLLYVTSDNGHLYAYRMSSVAPSSAAFNSIANGLAVDFGAVAPSNGSLYYYTWDFGDGNTTTGMAVSHTYAKAGSYTVVLTISNPAGDSVNTTKSLSLAISNNSSDIPMWAWIVLLVAIVAVVGLAVFMMRRKK